MRFADDYIDSFVTREIKVAINAAFPVRGAKWSRSIDWNADAEGAIEGGIPDVIARTREIGNYKFTIIHELDWDFYDTDSEGEEYEDPADCLQDESWRVAVVYNDPNGPVKLLDRTYTELTVNSLPQDLAAAKQQLDELLGRA